MNENRKKNTITVLGAGYVGLTTAALFAHSGYTVYAIEPNPERLKVIQSGKSFFYENGMDILIKTALDNGNLIATDSYEVSVPKSSIVFSSVGTPDNPDGSSNLTYVFSAATEAAKYMTKGAIYVQKSTVPVGTGRRVEELFLKQDRKDIEYVSNPEFLREGTAVYDTLYFDRVVAGGDNEKAIHALLDAYRELEMNREAIAELAHIKKNTQVGKYISTNLNSAELIKVTSNAFLAMKISFANSIAKLSDAAGADIVEVMDAVGADERIGRAFLNAGRGYGGGCFPKDVSGLISSGKDYGVDLKIMETTQDVNSSMPKYIVEKLEGIVGSLLNKKIAVLGLAFKAGTSDARKSPGVTIANMLAKSGAIVYAYDPKANDEASDDLDKSISLISSSIADAVVDTDIIVITTEWPELIELGAKFANMSQAKILVDAINRINPTDVKESGLQYIGVGR